jgi:hypothetical protein
VEEIFLILLLILAYMRLSVQNGSINICLIHLFCGWDDHWLHLVELITFYLLVVAL